MTWTDGLTTGRHQSAVVMETLYCTSQLYISVFHIICYNAFLSATDRRRTRIRVETLRMLPVPWVEPRDREWRHWTRWCDRCSSSCRRVTTTRADRNQLSTCRWRRGDRARTAVICENVMTESVSTSDVFKSTVIFVDNWCIKWNKWASYEHLQEFGSTSEFWKNSHAFFIRFFFTETLAPYTSWL